MLVIFFTYLALIWLGPRHGYVSANPHPQELHGDVSIPNLDDIFSHLEVVRYDGPKYTMSAADWAARTNALATNGTWNPPADMPRINLTEGQLLVFDANHTKRSGNHYVAAYGGYNCDRNTIITAVQNFGCGTGCVTFPSRGLSGRVAQQYHGNPYPTMDVWENNGCNGNLLQHFGVDYTDSCTNTNCCGYRSFIGWYGC